MLFIVLVADFVLRDMQGYSPDFINLVEIDPTPMNEDSASKRIQPIDIRKIFYNKNPALARLLPGFVFRYLERIAHQQDINGFLEKHGEKMGLDFARAAILDFNVKVNIRGDENLPPKGRFIFAANHPLGGFDGILLMDVLSRYYNDFKFLSNDLLMNIINLHPVFIPINKHGKQATEAALKLDEAFLSDTHIVTFPAGLVSRKIGGEVMDLVWHKNFISKAIHYERDIVPVFFTGRNSDFFYRLFRIRSFLGIKANLEMFYLVDETFRHRNDTLTVTFGKPISYTVFDKSKTHPGWAKWVKEQVYALGGITKVPL
jgi:1-acyl-sn-glycerol-3-phosphate acyltransferase